jgi:hypothetical protein
MTVLFAYLSDRHDAGFICADDLEANNNGKVDKVFLQWRRFAIGITGPEFLRDALGLIGWFDHPVPVRYANGDVAHPISQVQELTNKLATVLPRIAKQQDRSFQDKLLKGVANQEQYDLWSEQCGALIILDYVERRLFEVANSTCVGNLVANIPPKFQIRGLPREKVYRFSGGEVISMVTPEVVANPRAYASSWINEAAKLTPNRLGPLGASLAFAGSEIEFHSALDNVDDVLSAYGF